MKKYFTINDVPHESKDGRYVLYKDVEELERALRIIRTWASFPGVLEDGRDIIIDMINGVL